MLIMLMGTVDVLMLSQISDGSVAAVGLVNQLLAMIFLIFIIAASGTLVVCSQYLGAQRYGDFLTTVNVSLLLNMLVGIVVSLALFWFGDNILGMMKTDQSIFQDASIYLKIVGSFAIFHGMAVTVGNILRAREMAAYPMYISIIANILNFLGNYGLIFGHFGLPAMGVAGAAWATVISRAVNLFLLLFIFYAKKVGKQRAKVCRDYKVKLKQILAIGVPGAGEMFSYLASQVVILYFINMLGTDELAARTYMTNIVTFSFIFAISLGQGTSILTGHLTGQHKYHAALLIGAYATRWAVKISISISLFLALLSPLFIPYLTQNPTITKLCLALFWVDITLEAGRAVNILTGRMLASVGDPLFPLRTSIIVVWSVATLGSFVVGIQLHFGLIGMWCMFLLDENLRAAIQWRHWKQGKWMHKSIC